MKQFIDRLYRANLWSILLISILQISSPLAAQEQFVNRKLAQIAQYMPTMQWPGKDTIIPIKQFGADKWLIIRYNGKGEINHMGISLFSKETKQMLDESICDFLERIFLELALQPSSSDVKRKLTEYHVHLRYNGYAFGEPPFTSIAYMLSELRMPVNFTIRYENKQALASWTLDNETTLSMLFPTSKELIDGMDKKESDNQMYYRLTDAQRQVSISTDNNVKENELEKQPDGSYLLKGSFFLIPSLNSDIYYTKKATGFAPIFSISTPEKSLSNLFQTRQNGIDKKLLITHRQYGYFTPEIELPLNNFLALFEKDFNIYSSTGKNKKGEWQTIVVIQHKILNYIHLLRAVTTNEALQENPLIMKADFFSNIPQHQIKNLFNVKTK